MDSIVYSDGELHVFKSDVRRPNFSRTYSTINTVAEFKATLRAGPYAWPGGYPMYFLCDDGEALSFKAARDHFRLVAEAIQNKESNGWRVIACDVNYEDGDLVCAHSGERIPAAYDTGDAIGNDPDYNDPH